LAWIDWWDSLVAKTFRYISNVWFINKVWVFNFEGGLTAKTRFDK